MLIKSVHVDQKHPLVIVSHHDNTVFIGRQPQAIKLLNLNKVLLLLLLLLYFTYIFRISLLRKK